MSKIEEFEKWAKQFIAIHDSHVKEFIGSIGDLSLHEMKVLFSKKNQDRIAFSYVLQMEKKIVNDLRIKEIKEKAYCEADAAGFGSYYKNIGKGDYGDNRHIIWHYIRFQETERDPGWGAGAGCGNKYGDVSSDGPDSKISFGFGCVYGDSWGSGRGSGSGLYASQHTYMDTEDLAAIINTSVVRINRAILAFGWQRRDFEDNWLVEPELNDIYYKRIPCGGKNYRLYWNVKAVIDRWNQVFATNIRFY